jgi:myo-inositol-1(or 4)-monophosphatase
MTSVEDSALELAEILAKEAVERARRAPDEVASKGNPFDVVTTVDTEIESLLRRRIRERFPEHAILGEEEGLQVGSAEWTWVLDPIDGTLNFATGFPIAVCSIAVLRGDRPRVGALGDLATRIVFSARTGGGLRSEPPACAPVGGDLGRVRLFIDFSPETPAPDVLDGLLAFADLAPVAPRMIGSAAAGLLAVASGGGCFAGVGLRLWDVAAGVVLVEESGGTVRRWDDDREHVVHVLAGDAGSVRRFEQAMLDAVHLWRVSDLRRKEGSHPADHEASRT